MLSKEISTQVKDKCENILSELIKVWQILQNTQQSQQYAHSEFSFNARGMSEVSCENHTAVGTEPKGHYIEKDTGGIRTTHEMSGYVSHPGFWDSKGIYEGEKELYFNL